GPLPHGAPPPSSTLDLPRAPGESPGPPFGAPGNGRAGTGASAPGGDPPKSRENGGCRLARVDPPATPGGARPTPEPQPRNPRDGMLHAVRARTDGGPPAPRTVHGHGSADPDDQGGGRDLPP